MKIERPNVTETKVVTTFSGAKKDTYFFDVEYKPSELAIEMVKYGDLKGFFEVKTIPYYDIAGDYIGSAMGRYDFKLNEILIKEGLPNTRFIAQLKERHWMYSKEEVIRHELIHKIFPEYNEVKVEYAGKVLLLNKRFAMGLALKLKDKPESEQYYNMIAILSKKPKFTVEQAAKLPQDLVTIIVKALGLMPDEGDEKKKLAQKPS